MKAKIAVLPGDGIGVEVTTEAVKVLHAVGQRFEHQFTPTEAVVGGAAIDAYGEALPAATMALCRAADAVLLGAVGGPKWDDPRATVRPEQALLGLRGGLRLYANIRPVRPLPYLLDASPIKREILEGTDIVVLRELTGGLYFGKPSRRTTYSTYIRAVDTLAYTSVEIERIVRQGFELARNRRKHLCSVDKANILTTGRLWREIATALAKDYPDVTLEHMLVDTAAMQLVRAPRRFDVIVTENTFGDILTDEASVLAGSMGLLPSASLGAKSKNGVRVGLYEPIHGTAPDIAGQGIANPLASILSVALMLRYTFGLEREATAVELAVDRALADGLRTPDLYSPQDDVRRVGTGEMTTAVLAHLATA